MRIVPLVIAVQVGCSQVKEADTSVVIEDTANEDTGSSEPSSEETDSTDTSETTEDVGMVVINEICVEDSSTEDWVELYNSSDIDMDVSGWMIGDDEADMVLIDDLMTDTVVPAGGFVQVFTKVVLTDGTEVGFGLKKDGSETLFVQMGDSTWSVAAPSNDGVADTSYARIPNGSDTWENGVSATPGASNE